MNTQQGYLLVPLQIDDQVFTLSLDYKLQQCRVILKKENRVGWVQTQTPSSCTALRRGAGRASAVAGSGPAWEKQAATRRSVCGVAALEPQLSANRRGEAAAGLHTRLRWTPRCALKQLHRLQLCTSECISPAKISVALQYASVPGDIGYSFEFSLFPLRIIA